MPLAAWWQSFMLPWWGAGFIACVAIITIEYINSQTGATRWMEVLPRTFLLIMLAQWALFKMWSGAPTWMMAWIVFCLTNAMMRLSAVYWLAGSSVKSWAWTLSGSALMVCAVWMIHNGRGTG